MAFFTFNQNNSGGVFDFDDTKGISHHVIIEADNAVEANEIAEGIGIYFDYEYERDCDCCGMRWYPVNQYDKDEDSGVPNVYGTPIEDYKPTIKWMKGPEGYVHYKGGYVRPFAD